MPDDRDPLAALRRLLQDYDRANRLEIDAVYAQLSPTLDDFYAEELRLSFPPHRAGDGSGPETVRPEVVLTRDIPGLTVRRATAPGAPFPIREAAQLLWRAAGALGAGDGLLAAVRRGEQWLAVRHVPRTQRVQLVLEPAGADALAELERLIAPPS